MIMWSSRDGQKVDGNTLGGVISNLHLPRDWWIFEVEPTGENTRELAVIVRLHSRLLQLFRGIQDSLQPHSIVRN